MLSNGFSTVVTQAQVTSGTLGSISNSSLSFSQPYGLVFDSSGTNVYISNLNSANGYLSYCTYDTGTNSISSCGTYTNSNNPRPQGIALSANGNYLYDAEQTNSVFQCTVSSGVISNCTNTNIAFVYPDYGLAVY